MKCIIDGFRKSAQEFPDKILLITEDKQYTYGDFLIYCYSISMELKKRGVRKGERVAIVLDKYDEFYGALLAVWQLGGVVVPLNVTLNDSQLQNLIDRSGSKFLITANVMSRELKTTTAIDIEEISITAEEPPYNDKLAAAELAAIMFTSGTTGMPKGVCQTYFAQCENVAMTAQALELTPEDRVFINTPPYFTSGLSHFLTMLAVEGSLVGIKRFYFGGDLLEALENYECTGFGGAPVHLNRVVETLAEPYANSRVAFWMSSGDYLPSSAVKKAKTLLPNVKLFNVYGLTEVAGRFCVLHPRWIEEKCGSVGRPMGHMKATIRDENLNEVSPYEVGEVFAQGTLLMEGYLDNAELTGKALTKFGFSTGDFGYMDKDGFIWLEGRRDDIFKRAGEKVSTNQIKQALTTLEMIDDAAVIAVDDDFTGKEPVAFVVIKQGGTVRSVLIRKELKKILPQTHIPAQILFVECIPRTGSGKVIKAELLKMLNINKGDA